MATLTVLRGAEDAERAERRLAAARRRFGIGARWAGVLRDMAAGSGIVVIADVGDDDPDADIAIYFHREPDEPPHTIWVQELWTRSGRLLRVYEAACLIMQTFGITVARVGKSDAAYTTRAVQIGQPDDAGEWWEFDVARMLARTRAVIQQRGEPPL